MSLGLFLGENQITHSHPYVLFCNYYLWHCSYLSFCSLISCSCQAHATCTQVCKAWHLHGVHFIATFIYSEWKFVAWNKLPEIPSWNPAVKSEVQLNWPLNEINSCTYAVNFTALVLCMRAIILTRYVADCYEWQIIIG